MTSKLSYIFKYKEQKTKKAKEKQTENIVLTTWTFKQTLMHHLNLSKEQCTIEDVGVIFTISINDVQSCWNGVKITVHQSPHVMFLDVFVDGVQANNIGVLESFDSALVKPRVITTYSGYKVCIVQDYQEAKKIRLIDVDGEEFIGYVVDVTDSEEYMYDEIDDIENFEDGITLKVGEKHIEFMQSEIKLIEVLEWEKWEN